MAEPTHTIRTQHLEVEVATEAVALALQPRFADFNRQRLLPVIERVLAEADRPGQLIRIGRLAVDLGNLPLDGFEDAAEAALYDALQRGLREAIESQDEAGEGGSPPADNGRIELLAEYLRRGTLPFWSPSVGVPAEDFSATALIQQLAVTAPAALAALIRRLGGERHVLDRLALVLDEATLQALLRLIEPAHAALILAYMLDLRHIHRAEPLLPLGDMAFARLLWSLTFGYLLREAGTQFNRKSYVAALLRGMAQSEGLEYAALITTLERGLRQTLRHLPLTSSLPAVIGEIAREAGVETAAPDFGPEFAADAESDERLEQSDLEPATVAALVRRYAADRRKLDNLISALDEPVLQQVLRLLEPVHAATILAYLVDLRHVYRVEPLLPLGDEAFARLLWLVTFSYVVRDAGSQFNRRSFMRMLLAGLARSEGVEFAALAETLARGLRRMATHKPLSSSLPAVVEEILREIDDERGNAVTIAEIAGDFSAADPPRLAALIRRYHGDRGVLERLVGELDDAALEAVLRLLEPAHAALVISYMLDLRRMQAGAPGLPESEEQLRNLLWVVALSYFAQDAGSQFNRKSFVRHLLEGVARNEEVGYATLLTTLAEALRLTASHRPVVSSLPLVIDELAGEAIPVPPAADSPAPVFERYARQDALIFYLRHDVLPADIRARRPELSAAGFEAELVSLSLRQLRAAFSPLSPAERTAALVRVVRGLSMDAVAAWAGRLLPPRSFDGLPDAIGAAAAAAANRNLFYARLVAALIDGSELDLETIGETGPPEGPDIDTISPDHAQGALLAALRGESGGEAGQFGHVEALLARRPADTQLFLQAIASAPDRDVLLSRLPMPLFRRLIALTPRVEIPGVQVLDLFQSVIGDLPMSERASAQAALRTALLEEALRSGQGLGSGPGAVERIMRALFGEQVPAFVARRLREASVSGGISQTLQREIAGVLTLAGGKSEVQPAKTPIAAMRDDLFAWLGGAEPAASFALGDLLRNLPEIVAAFAGDMQAFLFAHAKNPALVQRWSRHLPEVALARLVHALEPGQFRPLIDAAEILHEAGIDVAMAARALRPPRAALWDMLFGYLAATAPAERSAAGLWAHKIAQAPDNAEMFTQSVSRLADAAGSQNLAAALARERKPGVTAESPPAKPDRQWPRPKPVRSRTAFGMDEADVAEGEPIYISNAGLVLAGVFLPHLFRSLGFLAEGEDRRMSMRDHETASRAVHLLQYLADGRCNAPEPLLVLNKILCGMPVAAPILSEIVPTERETALCDSLLHAMISRWEIIKDSSVAALRETFLKREGKLIRKADAWDLRVERKTLDVLVDRVPWNVSLIYNAWMPEPLHVTW